MTKNRYSREFESQALVKVRERAEKSVGTIALKLTPFHGHFQTERKSPRCPRRSHRIHPDFASRWWSWYAAAASPASCPRNLAATPPAS